MDLEEYLKEVVKSLEWVKRSNDLVMYRSRIPAFRNNYWIFPTLEAVKGKRLPEEAIIAGEVLYKENTYAVKIVDINLSHIAGIMKSGGFGSKADPLILLAMSGKKRVEWGTQKFLKTEMSDFEKILEGKKEL